MTAIYRYDAYIRIDLIKRNDTTIQYAGTMLCTFIKTVDDRNSSINQPPLRLTIQPNCGDKFIKPVQRKTINTEKKDCSTGEMPPLKYPDQTPVCSNLSNKLAHD